MGVNASAERAAAWVHYGDPCGRLRSNNERENNAVLCPTERDEIAISQPKLKRILFI